VKLGPLVAADGTLTGTADGISHDFVVAFMQTSALTGDYCLSLKVLLRPGSLSGSIFENVPNDFYCLNPYVDTSVLVSPEAIDTTSCPFNPAIAIIDRYAVTASGLLPAIADGPVLVNTSDGPDNCFPSTAGTNVCYGYDRENGWTGYVQADIDHTSYTCDLDRSYYSELTEDTSVDFGCDPGQSAVVRGSITLIETDLAGIALGLERQYLDASGVTTTYTDSLPCQINATETNFSCVTGNLAINPPDGSWAGDWKVSLNVSTGYVCNDLDDSEGDGVMLIADPVVPGVYSQPVIAARNANKCP
jgi:hypothetical protein